MLKKFNFNRLLLLLFLLTSVKIANTQSSYSAFNKTVFEKFVSKQIKSLKSKIFEACLHGKIPIYRDEYLDLTYDTVAFYNAISSSENKSDYEGYGDKSEERTLLYTSEDIISLNFLHESTSKFPNKNLNLKLKAIEFYLEHADSSDGFSISIENYSFYLKTEDIENLLTPLQMNYLLMFKEFSMTNDKLKKESGLSDNLHYKTESAFDVTGFINDNLLLSTLTNSIEEGWKTGGISCYTDPLHKKLLTYQEFKNQNKLVFIDGTDTLYNDFQFKYINDFEWWIEKEVWLNVKVGGKPKVEFQLRYNELKPFLAPWVALILDEYIVSLKS